MRTRDLLIALAAGTAAAQAETGATPIALEWQRYSGRTAGHVYVNAATGERVVSTDTAIGSAAGRGVPWTWSTAIPDPCEGAAGVLPDAQGIGVFTGIMSEGNGDAQQPNAVRLWQNWFDAPADALVNGFTIQYYTGLQDPGFTPGDPDNSGYPEGIPGYDMIVVFTENDDPDSQTTAVAHSPVLVTLLPGANDSDGNGTIDFSEGMLWTLFLDIVDTPIEIADSDGSSVNPQGSDTDEPGTVGHGLSDCGFLVTFRQPNVVEGDRMFLDNALIDFSNVDLDPVTGIGNPDGPDPDVATFANILPTGTGLYAPSNRLETFPQTPGVVSQWPADPTVAIEEGEGYGSWDAMEIFDATGADESGDNQLFNFGGFACLTPGGGTDGYDTPYSSFQIMFNINGAPPGANRCAQTGRSCAIADINDDQVLDLTDITLFLFHFLDGNLDCADVDDNGILDLADINAFVASFLVGCP